MRFSCLSSMPGSGWRNLPGGCPALRPIPLLAVMILPLLVANSCAGVESSDAAPVSLSANTADYLPLSPGRRWVLRHVSGKSSMGEIVMQVVEARQGVYRMMFKNPWVRAEWSLRPQAGRIFMVQGRLEDKAFDLPAGTLYFDFNAPRGHSWSNAIGKFTVKSRDLTIKTPAGTFQSCIRFQETSPAGNSMLWTFAPGVGFVMFGEGGSAYVLAKIENAGTPAGIQEPPSSSVNPPPAASSSTAPVRVARGVTFALSANPLANESFTPATITRRVKESLAAGVNSMYASMEYKKLVPRVGEFKPAEVDGDLGNARRFGLRDMMFTLRIVDTNNRSLPADLARVPFDDPRLWKNVAETIDSLAPRLGGVSRINIGNEVDSYFGQHRREIAAYTTLFIKARDRLKQRLPNIRVSVTLTFGGLVDDSLRRDLRPLLDAADYLCLTYYPLNANFTMRPPETVAGDFERMRTLAGELGKRTVVLQEVGYPSSPLNNSSPEKQAAFYRNVIEAVNRHPETFVFLNFFLMSDLPDWMVEEFAKYYKLPGQDRFKAYLKTLGVFDGQGNPKPAWDVLRIPN